MHCSITVQQKQHLTSTTLEKAEGPQVPGSVLSTEQSHCSAPIGSSYPAALIPSDPHRPIIIPRRLPPIIHPPPTSSSLFSFHVDSSNSSFLSLAILHTHIRSNTHRAYPAYQTRPFLSYLLPIDDPPTRPAALVASDLLPRPHHSSLPHPRVLVVKASFYLVLPLSVFLRSPTTPITKPSRLAIVGNTLVKSSAAASLFVATALGFTLFQKSPRAHPRNRHLL